MKKMLLQALEGLSPGYFALVMATGIVAAASEEWGLHTLGMTLFGVAGLAHVVLLIINGARALMVPQRVLADCTDPRTCFAFFTLVAGGNVLASWLAVHHYAAIASWLWALDGVLGLLLVYVVFTGLVIRNSQPISACVNGTWLIVVVAVHSIVIVGVDLSTSLREIIPNLTFVAWLLWACGMALYAFILSIVWQRLLFGEVSPDDLSPPYWISMGAAAIGALAGTRLLTAQEVGASHGVELLIPITYALTLFMWAWATWWIPQLLIFGVWRHVTHRRSVLYEPSLWGMVFPLGMYATVTAEIQEMTQWRPLATMSFLFLWLAVAAWVATFGGMVRSWLSHLARQNSRSDQPRSM